MTKSKLEKVLEYMVNGNNELASEMLHEHLIETARDIYADLSEEDDLAEDELDLDDVDESIHDGDESGDFEDDIETIEDELETEEYFGEDEDEDESLDDLEGEMDMDDEFDDMDMDVDLDPEADDDLEVEPNDAEEAMVNVEDAMDELRAAFADLMGDEDDTEDDEVSDEFDDMDIDTNDMDDEFDDEDDDFEDDELGENAKLQKHNVSMSGNEDHKASPIKQNQPNMGNHGKAVDFAKGDEKGGKGDSAKKMNVTGPQDQKGKMDKKVSTPANKSEKSKSNLGS